MIIKLFIYEGYETPVFAETLADAKAIVNHEIMQSLSYGGRYFSFYPTFDPKGTHDCPVWEYREIRKHGEKPSYFWQIWELTPLTLASYIQMRERERDEERQRYAKWKESEQKKKEKALKKQLKISNQ